MYIHCDQYWKDMDLMLTNFAIGVRPIDTGCLHTNPCPICAALNHQSIVGNHLITDREL